MNERDPSRLFEDLDPPPGGLTRLRARLRTEHRRRIRNRALAVTAAAGTAIGLAAFLVLSGGGDPAANLPGLTSDLVAIRLGLAEAPTEVVSVRAELRREYAVRRLPTSDDRVVFYAVGSR